MVSSLRLCDACGKSNKAQARFCHACGQPLHVGTGQLQVNTLLKQRYRIQRVVGQGGFGAVYLAEDIQLGNRRIALKEMSQSSLKPQDRQAMVSAFKQEAYMLAGLQHPNLPGIVEHFEENQRWYLVMNFIEGETLEEYLQHQGGKLPLDETLRIGIQLSTVLDYLHRRHPPIIFRDLKPDNIMRTSNGDLYLIDFGIARHFKPGQARDTLALGSPGYAPPEQYGKAQTTPRSDIYSLGAILHQLLSGHDPSSKPFQFAPLQAVVPSVRKHLATFITQMLDMDENNRPATMQQVKQNLQAALSLQPPMPSPTPPIQPVPSPQPPMPFPTPPIQPSSIPSLPPVPRPIMPVLLPPPVAPSPQGTRLLYYIGHSQAVQTARWSPDGKRIASASEDQTVHTWSVENYRQIFRHPGKNSAVCSVAWSPDGKRITTATSDMMVRLWDIRDHERPLISRSLSRRNHLSLPVECSPDGRRVAFVSRTGMIQVEEVGGSKPPLVDRGHASLFGLIRSLEVISLLWSPDCCRIASVCNDQTIQIWNTNGNHDLLLCRGHAASAHSVAWSPDGKSLAFCSQNHEVQVWNIDAKSLSLVYKGHSDTVLAVAWSPDSMRLASLSQDKTVQVWDAQSGRQFHVYHGHASATRSFACCSVAWSPDGQWIASVYNDKMMHVTSERTTPFYSDMTVHVWNVDGRGGPFIYASHTAAVQLVVWSPDGKHLATASQDNRDRTVHVWSIDDGKWQPFVYRGHPTALQALAWSPDGERIASASQDGTVQVWNADTFVREGHSATVWSVAWSPDGKQIASASADRTVQVSRVDGSGGISVYAYQGSAVYAVAWSPDGKRIAFASEDQTVRVGSADGSGKAYVYTGHKDAVLALAWSPDGTWIASASRDQSVHVWNVDEHGSMSFFFSYTGHGDAVHALAWSPDGTRIVSASQAQADAVHVWDISGQGPTYIYPDHNYFSGETRVTAVAWSPDGTRIASCTASTSPRSTIPDAADKVVHIWNADGSGKPYIYPGHSDAVLSVAWSPDGTRIVSTSRDRTVQVWSAG